MKDLRITLADSIGKRFVWSIRRVPRAINCTLGQTRVISGWSFTDHDGYERFSEGNWSNLPPMIRQTAENYGFTLVSQLS